jgi:hypothetical protein
MQCAGYQQIYAILIISLCVIVNKVCHFVYNELCQLEFNKLQDFLEFIELKRQHLSLWKIKFTEYTFSEQSNCHAEIPF